jgi:hypothetical protein
MVKALYSKDRCVTNIWYLLKCKIILICFTTFQTQKRSCFKRVKNFYCGYQWRITNCSDFTAHHYDNGTCDKLLYNILMLPTWFLTKRLSNRTEVADIYFYSKTNQMHTISNLFYFGNNTLHVSDSLSIHHQESKTVHTTSGICHTGSVAAC